MRVLVDQASLAGTLLCNYLQGCELLAKEDLTAAGVCVCVCAHMHTCACVEPSPPLQCAHTQLKGRAESLRPPKTL